MAQNNGMQTMTAASSPILVAQNLRKSYDNRLALRDLSFTLYAGRVMGFLGPNGAGKTTAIRILTTIFEPSSGQFFVAGIGSDSNRTALFVSLFVTVLFLLPTQFPGTAQTGFMGILVKRINPMESVNQILQ